MKERTFYTINLDLSRIVVLGLILVGLLAYFFMLGNAMGKKSAHKEMENKDATVHSEEEHKPKEKAPIKIEEESSPASHEEKVKEDVVDLKPAPSKTANNTVLEVKEEVIKPVVTPPVKTVTPVKKTTVTNPVPSRSIVIEEKGYFTIQLGAFSSQEQAIKFKETVLSKNKLGGKLSPYIQKNADFFVVRVGRSTAKEDLEKIILKLDAGTQASAMIVRNSKN